MNKLLVIFLGLGFFSQQALAVPVLGEDFSAYANSVVGKSGSFLTDLGNAVDGTNWSSADIDVDGAITDASAETSMLGTSAGAYVDLAFSAPVFDGDGNDLKLFFVGNNGHFFDLSVFVDGVSMGTVSYSLPNPDGDTGFTDSSYPTDGIFALAVDFADFGGLGIDPVSKIRLIIGDGYTANSAVPSFIGAYNVAPVPVPAAVWLFGSGLLGLAGISRRKS